MGGGGGAVGYERYTEMGVDPRFSVSLPDFLVSAVLAKPCVAHVFLRDVPTFVCHIPAIVPVHQPHVEYLGRYET